PRRPAGAVRPLEASGAVGVRRELAPVEAPLRAEPLGAASSSLADLECEPELRRFEPVELPAMLLGDREGDHQRELDRTRAEGDDVWGGVLGSFSAETPARRLVLNLDSAVVARLMAAPPGPVRAAGLRAV